MTAALAEERFLLVGLGVTNGAVARALLAHETIDGAEVGRLVDGAMGRRAGGFRRMRRADGTVTEVRPGETDLPSAGEPGEPSVLEPSARFDAPT